MKLQNNLYSIVERKEDGFCIALNAESLIYKAHFPEQPITPGVCIIQIANELLEELLNQKVEIKEVVNAKFLSVINPIENNKVAYTFSKMVKDNLNHTLKMTVSVASEETVCAKLSLLYCLND